jgi:hypothetical protein
MIVPAERWHKNRLCKLLGHKITGYRGGTPYLRKSGTVETDGLGVRHVYLHGRCDRCSESVLVAKIHERRTEHGDRGGNHQGDT